MTDHVVAVKDVPVRAAEVRGGRDAEQVARYLPACYEVVEVRSGAIMIAGQDVAGWTMDGYVIPRLASGMIWAREVDSRTVPAPFSGFDQSTVEGERESTATRLGMTLAEFDALATDPRLDAYFATFGAMGYSAEQVEEFRAFAVAGEAARLEDFARFLGRTDCTSDHPYRDGQDVDTR